MPRWSAVLGTVLVALLKGVPDNNGEGERD